MSIDHTAIQIACRVKLLTLSVCTTGSTTLAATATGYSRAAGSFLTDLFAPGMEITPAGFTTNTVDTITAVTALTLTTRNARTAEASASGRTISVGLPASIAAENKAFTPVGGVPYVEEQYIPGPEMVSTDGGQGLLELRPMYSPRVYVPANNGILADSRYADAIRALFKPCTVLTLPTGSSGDWCEVRKDTAPYRGQRAPSVTAGWSCIPITIPLKATTLSTVP
jgi:hypothetical protein